MIVDTRRSIVADCLSIEMGHIVSCHILPVWKGQHLACNTDTRLLHNKRLIVIKHAMMKYTLQRAPSIYCVPEVVLVQVPGGSGTAADAFPRKLKPKRIKAPHASMVVFTFGITSASHQ